MVNPLMSATGEVKRGVLFVWGLLLHRMLVNEPDGKSLYVYLYLFVSIPLSLFPAPPHASIVIMHSQHCSLRSGENESARKRARFRFRIRMRVDGDGEVGVRTRYGELTSSYCSSSSCADNCGCSLCCPLLISGAGADW